ncbi:MAG: hypothetical protein CL917_16955 [Deltaproteobacteria bacterium]|nr:hypothetical protein [Deltaproteobacteria bacterium]
MLHFLLWSSRLKRGLTNSLGFLYRIWKRVYSLNGNRLAPTSSSLFVEIPKQLYDASPSRLDRSPENIYKVCS